MNLAISAFKTEERRQINRLNNKVRVEMKFKKASEICPICVFWLLMSSAYDLVLS